MLSDKQTEIELNKLTARIQEVYKVAWAEARQEASAYFRQFEARYKKEFKAFEQGAYTQDQFSRWYWAQVGRGEKWEKVRDNMRDTFTQANVTAASMTKSAMPGVYALNANYEAYQIYKKTGIDFALYDEATVAGIMQGKTKILPSSRVSIPKSDAWNIKQLENSLLSGILQGKSIDKIADVFQNVASMDRNAAIRNARTAMTAAQNAGRQDTYERAHDMGIEMQKEWMATIDERTRESHAELDGVRVEYDEEFPNGLMFPGDASGEPSEIYNCRCTIRAILPKYNGQERLSEIEGHEGIHTKETYKEWEDRKREEQMLNSKPTSYTDATARATEMKEATQAIEKLPEATDRASANKLLEEELGVYVDDTTKKINERLYVDATNQLIRLDNRFKAIEKSSHSSIVSVASGRAEAYVSNPATNPTDMKLSLCPGAFKSFDSNVESIEQQIDKQWAMPCAADKFSVYDVTHEYGHMLQNILTADYYRSQGWDDQDARKYVDMSARTRKGMFKWYKDKEKDFAKSVYNDIISIAKSNNPDFRLADNISDYGKSNYFEFFAEVFANSQLGEPNELGVATEMWLKKKGY